MSTHYILVGGNDRASKRYWLNLQKAINAPKGAKILSCLFAKPREDWENRYYTFWKPLLTAAFEDSTCEMAKPDTFRKQVAEADIIYIHGGDDALLATYLDKFEDLAEMFEGKVVIGSSAGADYIADHYWGYDWREVRKGRGLVDADVITHFGADTAPTPPLVDPRESVDWEKAKEALENAVKGQKVTTIREGEFVEYKV